jgi:hypothetical protein
MPVRRAVPKRTVTRIRRLVLKSSRATAKSERALLELHAAVYEASLDLGRYSDGALAEQLGVPRSTVQGWRERGRTAAG